MSWKFVLNTSSLSLESASRTAQVAGYDFFLFKGKVYFVYNGIYHPTKILEKDLF